MSIKTLRLSFVFSLILALFVPITPKETANASSLLISNNKAAAEINSAAMESPAEIATGLSAGSLHTCALTTGGGVRCWGSNYSGQLGDGTTIDRSTPVDVTGLTSGVSAISARGQYTCALTTTGGVKCWGSNGAGQLGDGTTTDRSTPMDVVGLASGVSAISSGQDHICALTTGGGIKCWGYNGYGQLGDGTTTDRSTPVDVVGLTSGVSAIAAGYDHTCALTTGGEVKCWGYNNSGQLGNGNATDCTTPANVVGLTSGVSAVAAGGQHTCAITTDGGVKCWGFNGSGQLGDGTTTSRLTPVDVVGLVSGVSAVALGSDHSCALTTAGGVKCWGFNSSGQLGDGTTTSRFTPVDVAGLSIGASGITAGGGHTCALVTGGGVKCWGWNIFGQLGDGTTSSFSIPLDVVDLTSGISAITAGDQDTCALTIFGEAKCWGFNNSGQLGDGTASNRSTPVDVVGLTNGVSAVAAGGEHTCALTTSGGVKCWGRNDYGQLGDGTTTDQSTPVDVVGLTSGVSAISVGDYHTCALTTGGGIKCWGWNIFGQLGDGTFTSHYTPVDVVGLTSGGSAVAAGGEHTCALTTSGGVKCWGMNYSGELGNGTNLNNSSTTVDVVGLASGVSAVTAESWHTCALTTGGGVKCWGNNGTGQLGDGTTTDQSTPVDVVELDSGVSAIDSGGGHTCALTTGGGVKCWGGNINGQLGDGTTTSRLTPVDVVGQDSGVSAISVGGSHTCALTTGGGIKCWGNNDSGQLGWKTLWVPADVIGFGVETLFLPFVNKN